jgi:FtsP/CotA-like multicopper oxidase with cupredoxin domain
MSKKLLLVAVLAVGVLVTGGLFVRSNNHNSMSMSSSDKASLQSMMGVASADQLPLKTAADQKPLVPTVKDGVKEFNLTAEPIRWQYANGKTITAWAYNGQIPGPEIRVTEGDKVKITFTNKLPKATTIHWHGLDVPNNMDGVPGVTQDAIKPGASFTYEFTATPAGTHFYHTHGSNTTDEAQQSDMGLSGAFVVEPANYQRPDKEYTLVLDDWLKGSGNFNMAMQDMNMDSMNMNYNLFTINGLASPDTKPLTVKQGDKVRIRLINASASTTHPMHLHGHQFKIVATDGNPVPEAAQLTKNTVALSPGETYDIEFTADNPGVWAFHCHELHHAEAGMMTLLKYEGYNAPAASTNSGNDSSQQMNHDMMDMPGM